MKPPAKLSDSDVAKNNKEICVERFKHWWPTDEKLREIINSVLPKHYGTTKNLLEIIEDERKITNVDKLAELLYDIVGPHFLHQVYAEDSEKRITPNLKAVILTACTENEPPDFSTESIIDLWENNLPPGVSAAQSRQGYDFDFSNP